MNRPVAARARSLPTILLAGIVPATAAVAVVTTFALTSAPGARSTGGLEISDFTFAPRVLEVRAGEPVTVNNRDGAAHTVTARDGAFDSGDLAGGASTTLRVDRAGRYRYFCEIHDYMQGVLDVR